ncbi:MAG: hypothetical protein ACKO3N_01225 [Verrucomicrobiota bacterium]
MPLPSARPGRWALHPDGRRLYLASTGTFPPDLFAYTVEAAAGQVVLRWDSPYHGDHPMAPPLVCTPDGTRLLTGAGTVFRATGEPGTDLEFETSLGRLATAYAMDPTNRAVFAAAGGEVRHHHLQSLQPVSTNTFPGTIVGLAVVGDELVVVSSEEGRARLLRQPNPASGAGTNQPAEPRFAVAAQPQGTGWRIDLDAGGSTDDGAGPLPLRYRWDLDGNGTYDTPLTPEPRWVTNAPLAGSRPVRLEVIDGFGMSATATQVLNLGFVEPPRLDPGTNAHFEVITPPGRVAFDPVRPLAYLTGSAARRLFTVNLTNGLVVQTRVYDRVPESVAVSPDGRRLAVALLGQERRIVAGPLRPAALVEYDLESGAETGPVVMASDPGDLVVTDGGLIVVAGGSGQWTTLDSYRLPEARRLGSASIRHLSWLALHPSQTAVYASDTDQSPAEVRRFPFFPETGALLNGWDSPYHGQYAMGGPVRFSPDGTRLITPGGSLFSSASSQGLDLRYQGSVGPGGVRDALFHGPSGSILGIDATSGQLVQWSDTTLGVVHSEPTLTGAQHLQDAGRHLIVARRDSDRVVFRRLRNPANPEPYIVEGPTDGFLVGGSTRTLAATVTGRAPLHFQGYREGAPVPQATNRTVEIPGNELLAGRYHLTVSNLFGVAESGPARLVMRYVPRVVRGPMNREVPAGATVQLEVEAAGSEPLSYQWTFEGRPLAGATNATLVIAGAQAAQAGAYAVSLRNDLGEARSTPALLRVVPSALRLSVEDPDRVILAGDDLRVEGQWIGSAPVGFQWYREDRPIPGATGPILLLPDLPAALAGGYRLQASNAFGSITSRVVSVTVSESAPRIRADLADARVVAGAPLRLAAEVRGSEPMAFQWFFKGLAIPGARQREWVVDPASPAAVGAYHRVATNPLGQAVTRTNRVEVEVRPLVFLDVPRGVVVETGEMFRLEGRVAGSGPVAFEWLRGEQPVPGATCARLEITHATRALAGAYRLVARSPYSSITSPPAAVVVREAPRFTANLTNRVVDAGTRVELVAAVTGDETLRVRWMVGPWSDPLSTNRVLELGAVGPDQAGVYSLRVDNFSGTVTQQVTLFVWPAAGAVESWGEEALGLGSVPVGLDDVVGLAAGDFHSAVLRRDGRVEVWGDASWGQRTLPPGLRPAVGLASGTDHLLAVHLDGSVSAWGRNDAGQATVPAWLTNVVALAAGERHSAALLQGGTLAVWGAGDEGQTSVPAGARAARALASGRNHLLALTGLGTVVAWGMNSHGQATVPAGLGGVRAVAAGYLHSLALRTNGTVVAWGDSSFGQATVPAGLTDVVEIAAGEIHSLARLANGRVVVWGAMEADRAPTAGSFTRIASGAYHALGVTPAGLDIRRTGSGLEVRWRGTQRLLEADALEGPWQWVPGDPAGSWTAPGGAGSHRWFQLWRRP